MAKSRGGEQNTGSAGKDNLPPARAESGGLLGRLGGALLPRRWFVDVPAASTKGATARNQQNGGTPAPAQPRPPMGRMLIGLLAYLVGSIVLQYVLIWLSVTFKLHLERTQALFPRNTPVVGAMSTYSLLYLLFLIALIWGLYRFNVLPRNLFGTRAAQRNATPAAPPSDGNRRSAAARRARRASQASATTSATNTTRASARPATTSTRRAPVQPPPATKATNGSDDEAYERVKALQRSRRRKK